MDDREQAGWIAQGISSSHLPVETTIGGPRTLCQGLGRTQGIIMFQAGKSLVQVGFLTINDILVVYAGHFLLKFSQESLIYQEVLECQC